MKHTCLSLDDHIFVCLNVSRTPSAQHSLHSMLWGGVGIQVEHLSRGSWQIECCTHGELCILWEVKHFGGVWAFACSRIGCVEPLPLSGGTGALPLHDCVEPCLFLEGSCFVDRLRRVVAHGFGLSHSVWSFLTFLWLLIIWMRFSGFCTSNHFFVLDSCQVTHQGGEMFQTMSINNHVNKYLGLLGDEWLTTLVEIGLSVLLLGSFEDVLWLLGGVEL